MLRPPISETSYTYDALNRLISAHDNYGNSTRTYTYDRLGKLTYEIGIGSHNKDYRYNNLNQLVEQSDDGWKTYTTSSYDNRGNNHIYCHPQTSKMHYCYSSMDFTKNDGLAISVNSTKSVMTTLL